MKSRNVLCYATKLNETDERGVFERKHVETDAFLSEVKKEKAKGLPGRKHKDASRLNKPDISFSYLHIC